MSEIKPTFCLTRKPQQNKMELKLTMFVSFMHIGSNPKLQQNRECHSGDTQGCHAILSRQCSVESKISLLHLWTLSQN